MALISSKNNQNDNEMSADFYYPTSKKALIIFTRNPEIGKVKTRLAKTVGDKIALEIYKFLLHHTEEITRNLKIDKYIFYSENIHKNDLWNSEIFRKKLQKGEDLGQRMQESFSELFTMGYEKIIIIGSDIIDLTQKDIEHAFERLEINSFVIGPAMDGGYYLLGMKKLKKELFQNKNWSTDSVLQDSLQDIREESYYLLPEKNDIDTYEDLKDLDVFQKFLLDV